MIGKIAVAALIGFCGYTYLSIRPPPPKICGTPGGPPVTSTRIKLRDGRHLAYKEKGVAKEEAKFKIVIVHGLGDSKDFDPPLSEELINEFQIYAVFFDRAGYGESDPNPTRSVKSEAFDIQELADTLQLGNKFFVVGISLGAYSIYSCLHYIPHRIAGAALVVPFVNYWWKFFPAALAKECFEERLRQNQWAFRVAHYAPWLLYWWMTQKWFPCLRTQRNFDVLSEPDQEIIKRRSTEPPQEGQVKVTQQGVHESLHRDMIVGFGKWEFDPTDIRNPFPDNEDHVHLWQGYEDRFISYKLNRYLSQQLPWIRYHEVPNAGHLLIYNATLCETIFKVLLSSNS
ncbi:uncharacterized protein LOC127244010 [Andrographis paniculata]|uniref:uncharacterized protein LOC127244010 n=1 Tax=Andrographis paniculata TaxID=175694 RepID=UPI0021E8A6D9|nr:uncharacterized protein LOC127244010 [Andrographis paniculata]